MAQALVRLPVSAARRQQLRLEKVGVIAGFLVGLVLALAVVSAPLAELGAPDWLEATAMALTVAVCTRLGLSAAFALASRQPAQ